MRIDHRAAALAAALSFCLPGLARAEDATLTARSGDLSVSGRLVAYDGAIYRIETRWGLLSVDAAAVDCAGPGCPDLTRFAPELRIAVEPWLAERVLLPLAAGFARAEGLSLTRNPADVLELSRDTRPELRIRLLPLTGGPEPVLAAGKADAALAQPEPSRGGGVLIARLPLAVVTASDAPPGPLALDALRDQRRRGDGWQRLTGVDQPLVWHGLAPGGTLDRATRAALGPAGGDMARTTDPAALALALGRDPWGVALLPAPTPPGLMPRQLVESCGLLPDLSDFAAAAGEHPLTAALHWSETGRRLPPVARAFANHLTGPAGQRDLAAAGVPGPSPLRRQGLADQGLRLINAVSARNDEVTLDQLRAALARLRGAERLALGFRLDDRGQALDAAGRSALVALSAHLASGALRGYEVLLLGFTDARGPAAENRALATRRAEAVLAALRAATPDLPPETLLSAEGLGELMPLTCDDSPEGRRLNRRVEVWVRPR